MTKLCKLMVVVLTVASLTGCHTCGGMGGWFNRGDSCEPAPPACPSGVPRATMMIPTQPGVLPGPIEIAPAN